MSPWGERIPAEIELRRAVWPDELDDEGNPTSAPFRAQDLSVDVGSLCELLATRERFPTSYIAILACRSFVELGYEPRYDPRADNEAHGVVPGKLTKAHARRVRNEVIHLHPPMYLT